MRIDASIHLLLLEGYILKHNDYLNFFTGTTHGVARVRLLGPTNLKGGESGFLQLELEDPICANFGDHFILRKASPSITVGGGVILDTQPRSATGASPARRPALSPGIVVLRPAAAALYCRHCTPQPFAPSPEVAMLHRRAGSPSLLPRTAARTLAAACALAAALAGVPARGADAPPAAPAPTVAAAPDAEQPVQGDRQGRGPRGARRAQRRDARQGREGTGVVIGEDGLILTIGYLIVEADDVKIVDRRGRSLPAQVVGYDHATGLGLVRSMVPLDAAPVTLGELGQARAPGAGADRQPRGADDVTLAHVVSRAAVHRRTGNTCSTRRSSPRRRRSTGAARRWSTRRHACSASAR